MKKKDRPAGDMEKLRLGQITNAVGLKGEIRVYPYTDYKEEFEEISYVLISEEKYVIEKVRYMKDMAVLKLHGIDDRTTAEKYKGQDLYIYREDAPPLPADTYYVIDLIGMLVVDEDGETIGRLKSVIKNSSAQDLYEVESVQTGNTFLVPAVEEFILKIDLDKGTVLVKLIEGLTEL